MRFFVSLLFVCLVLSLPARAQDGADDKSVLENWIERNLSGGGREVTITGFAGALSTRATFAELTIADDDGVWIRLSDVALDWDRTAVLQRRLVIQSLVAQEIELTRLPSGGSDVPNAQASDFSLPELPVSVSIDELLAERLLLGAAVLGEPAELRLEGNATLANGEGQAELGLVRIDGQDGEFALAGGYSNETRQFALDVALSEGEGGIAATLVGLPGKPPIDLTIEGNDPIDDFTAAIVLATDGEPRLAGEVALAAISQGEGERARRLIDVTADLSGDLQPLFEEQYRAFFGDETLLHLEATRLPDGTTDVADLYLQSQALTLRANARVNPLGWIEVADVEGQLQSPDAAPVVLPVSGDETTLRAATIAFDYDQERGDGWTASANLTGLERAGTTLRDITIAGAGRLRPGDGVPSISGRVSLAADDFVPADAALAKAIGPQLSGILSFAKADETPLELTDIAISGADYGLTGDARLSTDVDALDVIVALDVALTAADLSRFDVLVGQDLSGAAEVSISGDAALPGGAVDLRIAGETTDLAFGIAQFDGLFQGVSRLDLAVDRNQDRTRISQLSLVAKGAQMMGSGTLSADASTVTLDIDVPDGRLVDPLLTGAVALSADAVQVGDNWTIDADLSGPGELTAAIDATTRVVRGALGPVDASVNMRVVSLAPYSGIAGRSVSGGADAALRITGDLSSQDFEVIGTATGSNLGFGMGQVDQLLAGQSDLSFDVSRAGDGTIGIERVSLTSSQLSVSAKGGEDLSVPIQFDARLADVGLLVSGVSGAFSATGQAVLGTDAYALNVNGQGPAGLTVSVDGSVASNGASANLSLSGLAPLVLANAFTGANQLDGVARFDLRLDGPLALTSLSGRVSSSDARVSLPTLRVAAGPAQVNLNLQNGRARVELASPISSGGRIEVAGPVSLGDGFPAELTIRARNVGLTDPALYDTTVSGQVTVIGPLTGGAQVAGRLETGAVEIRIPSSGFGVASGLDGLRHVNEPRAVYNTRERAGKTGDAGDGAGGGPVYGLDVIVNVPNQVFIRGRGLDAELGGRLRLTGTTADVVPRGALSLIRGRLSLLGNRLDLTEARATLQGDFDPYIRVVALTEVDDVAIQVVLEGPATQPEVTFLSTPDLPQDEILARLIFGRALADISPLQALRLANGVATLTGRTGNGVMDNLRSGFGLSDLDVGTDDSGNVSVSAGTYISDKVYTGVQVGADGTAEVNINLDINKNLTARGSLGTDGDTSLGIYFEKDY